MILADDHNSIEYQLELDFNQGFMDDTKYYEIALGKAYNDLFAIKVFNCPNCNNEKTKFRWVWTFKFG